MPQHSLCKAACTMFLLCILSHAQTFKTIADFGGGNGAAPAAPLVQGIDGNFYGTTYSGGTWPGNGTIFRVTPQGKLTTIYTFRGYPYDGANPDGGLLLGADGNFYGTTVYGGNARCNTVADFGCGTVFKVTPSGKLTTLHNFARTADASDGIFPMGQLVQGVDGSLYGTTYEGGTAYSGTVFKITPAGAIATLYNFCTQYQCTDGYNPAAGLALGDDGDLYGTTSQGGANTVGYDGTIFKITSDGVFTTLHSFNGYDGFFPLGPLIRATDGNFYGTTWEGGAGSLADGTVFNITPGGTFTLLFSFNASNGNASPYGFHPLDGLVQGSDGNFYGTNFQGGEGFSCFGFYNCGAVFVLTPAGTPTNLHNFGTNRNGGSNPAGGLVQSTDGNFYGTAEYGGVNSFLSPAYGYGTVFNLSLGLNPFVAFVSPFGKINQTAGILGQGFTGATSVSFNGTASNFTVVSDTFIKATVPAGATTGPVTVTIASGSLQSNVPFQVIP